MPMYLKLHPCEHMRIALNIDQMWLFKVLLLLRPGFFKSTEEPSSEQIPVAEQMIHQVYPEFLHESSTQKHLVWEIYTDDSPRALLPIENTIYAVSLHQNQL